MIEKRITVNEAKTAYAKCGLVPGRGTFFSSNDSGDLCGCVVTAIVLADPPPGFPGFGLVSARQIVDHGNLTYGNPYLLGVMQGFDGKDDPVGFAGTSYPDDTHSRHRYLQGHRDGTAIAAAVLPA